MLETDTAILAGQRPGASFTVLAGDWPAGGGAPPLLHDDEDEAFYVLEGRLHVECGNSECAA